MIVIFRIPGLGRLVIIARIRDDNDDTATTTIRRGALTILSPGGI